MKYLFTGAAGFYWLPCLKALIARGDEVIDWDYREFLTNDVQFKICPIADLALIPEDIQIGKK